MKKIKLLSRVFLLTFIFSLLISCNQSSDALMNEKIKSPPLQQQEYLAPERWEGEIANNTDTINIKIDADIEIPNTKKYPVVKVKKKIITEEWAENIISRINHNGSLYTYNEDSPEEKTPINTISFSKNNSGVEQFVCGIDTGNKTLSQVIIMKTEQGGYLTFSNFDNKSAMPFKTTTNLSQMNHITISSEEAVNIGKQYLDSLGISGFDISLKLAGYMEINGNMPVEDLPQCYILYFTRTVEGTSTTYRNDKNDALLINEDMLQRQREENSYTPFWPQESIEMIITDTGVKYFDWRMPSEYTEIINSNVEILPFEAIKEIAEKEFALQGLWMNPNDTNIISREIVIDKITLGMMQVRNTESMNEFIMIPTWNFFGYEIYTYEEQMPGGYKLNEDHQYINTQTGGHSFLTINAIDGNIINPIIGY